MKRKSLFAIMSVLLVMSVSCVKEEPVKPVMSVEDKIIELQNVYELDHFTEKTNSYNLVFHSPSAITLDMEYPDGIKNIEVPKSIIKSFSDGKKDLHVFFTDGRSAVLGYHSWIDASLEKESICFSGEESISVGFTLIDSKPSGVEISAPYDGSNMEFTIEMNENGSNGTITVKCLNSQEDFSESVDVVFSNSEKSLSIPLLVENRKSENPPVPQTMSFDFREYERIFMVELENNDMLEAVIPEEKSSWIRCIITSEQIKSAQGKRYVYILMSENTGNSPRSATVSITRENRPEWVYLTLDLTQMGRYQRGSLRAGLEAFYKALNGNSWNEDDNWCSEKPLLEWYGIKASQTFTKSVFGLDGFAYYGTDDNWLLNLDANNMRGCIPDEFWEICSCFSVFSIRNEYLPGSVLSDRIWHKGLISLDLSMSFMTTPLTSSIAKAENLESLCLQCCNVGGSLPGEFTSLRHLQAVNMRECNISGNLPEGLGRLSELRSFQIDHNMELGGRIGTDLYNLTNLKTFDIGSTRIGGVLTSDVKKLTMLEDFNISGCEFEGTIPEEFGLLENLSGYDFNGNYFTSIPDFIRFYGYNSKYFRQWVASTGFPIGVPYFQRNKKDGRPAGYVVTVEDAFDIPDIMVDGKPLKRPGYYVNYDLCGKLPFPMWARVRYGIFCWTIGRDSEMKYPQYPQADDLQYPGNEYFFDGKDWRHPKLQYPAREYHFDGTSWIHDPSCPWYNEYIDPEVE